MSVWQRRSGSRRTVAAIVAPRGRILRLRMRVARGSRYRFWVGATGRRLVPLGGVIDGREVPGSDLGVRIALTVGGRARTAARFEYLRIVPTKPR